MFPRTSPKSVEDFELGMEDIRLDLCYDDHQLPSPEEVKTYGLKPRRTLAQRRGFRWACVGSLLFLTIILLLTVAIRSLVPSRDERSDDANGSIQQSGEAIFVDSRLHDTITFLLDEVNHRDLTNTSSPQFLAAQWMADVDSLRTPLVQESGFMERYALVVLWFATWGEEWLHSVDFLTGAHQCEWHSTFQRSDTSVFEMGVQCNERAEVKSLILQTMNLKGRIPLEISMLTSLERLSLDHNNLTDFEAVSPLTHLTQLTLGYNQFAADIPMWLGNFTLLEVLGLSNNGFTSTIPSQLKELASLTTLALDDNDLTGNLSLLEYMPLLEKVYLEDNAFTGTITNDFLHDLENLQVLDLSSNKLDGQVGLTLLNRPQLEVLDLHNNNLDGTLPEDMPYTATSLRFLALHDNFFEGSLPSTMTHLSALQHLDISNNRLTGALPDNWDQLSSLEYLFLSANRLFEPGPLPTSLKRLTHLRELSVKETARTGTIPSWIANLDQLILLDLDNNRFTSTLPSQLGRLTNLQFLLVNSNELTGKIPVELSSGLESSRLSLVMLDQNQFTGDADRLCSMDLPVLVADCDEVRCDCCTTCCYDDDQSCGDRGWLANYDPIWENQYTRDVYTFSAESSKHDIIFIPVN
eukprot:CAMPEP_0119014786 /NCGR_PEP_ID=MMETSP1176-20130426/10385_1 /TAXON_ID=265551 /ORGANISM="Synedropsis recta cf, Strain CCMP1620" /LENGTH=636 /DNA_ID=CAMNT_0006968027 /DNA_START=144 /DNA_END=2054 /DNA_ORIENTATION=-